MGSFRKLETRHVTVKGKRTCIAVEPEFWRVIDRLAEIGRMSWQQWAAVQVDLTQSGRASRLRVAALKEISDKTESNLPGKTS